MDVLGDIVIELSHPELNVDRTIGGVDSRGQLLQQAIAHGFIHATAVSFDKRVHQWRPYGL